MAKKILRMKLTDFINTELEDNIMSFLHMIKESTPTFIVSCWYEPYEINNIQLNEFKGKYLQSIELLEMSFCTLNSYETAVWYDIIGINDVERLSHFKFRSTYQSTNEIINCVLEFNGVIKFDSHKNTGYNKNGYSKDVKDSNYRFKKMGKSA